MLGVDFLKRINLENVFDTVFSDFDSDDERDLIVSCARVEVSSGKVSSILKELFVKNSENLNGTQKKFLLFFLMSSRMYFLKKSLLEIVMFLNIL